MTGRVAVFDCFSGIAGDMCLAALVDAGASLDAIRAGLERLGLPSFTITIEKVGRGGIEALYLRVDVDEERVYQPDEMRTMVRKAGFPARVEANVLATIDVLAAGESEAHGTGAPHFHEVGGVDALVDIAGTMLGLDLLDVEEARCAVVTVGSGTIVRSAHGAIPSAPGPAAASILQGAGYPMRFVEASHELVTPTGAAILAAVAKPGPATIRVTARGTGAGTSDSPNRPNALRIFVGETASEALPLRQLSLLEANIDDMSPALLAHARDLLLAEGAADAWFEPIAMKKGRPANKLCALVHRDDEARFADLMLRETTTLGVRVAQVQRYEATRVVETVATSLGPVRVKMGEWQGRRRRVPEFDDIREIALRTGMPAVDVQRLVEAELNERNR
jgi:pyridinium-3,5-bisthiocarboxylic acid mononucleotide nickel chelatase